jgi:hypothetical protein
MDSQDSSRPGLGEATTFPLIANSVHGHMASTQMTFCPGFPICSLEIPEIGTPATLEAYNFVCRPPIEMRSEAKL